LSDWKTIKMFLCKEIELAYLTLVLQKLADILLDHAY